MQKFVPNWKVMVMTLVFFIWALFVRDTMTLFQTYLMICVPAGWFVLNRLYPKKKKKKEKEEESRFGIPEVEDFISVIKFFVRLIMAIVIGPIALPFILIVGLIHLFTGGSGNNT